MSQQTSQTVDEQQVSGLADALVGIVGGVSRMFRKESDAKLFASKATDIQEPYVEKARFASEDLRESIKETLKEIRTVEKPMRDEGREAAKDFIEKAKTVRAEVKQIRKELQVQLASALVKRALGLI